MEEKIKLTEDQKKAVKFLLVSGGIVLTIASLSKFAKHEKKMFYKGADWGLSYILKHIPETRQPIYDYSIQHPNVLTCKRPDQY